MICVMEAKFLLNRRLLINILLIALLTKYSLLFPWNRKWVFCKKSNVQSIYQQEASLWQIILSVCLREIIRMIVVVDLLFNVHGKHRRSCRDGQLT